MSENDTTNKLVKIDNKELAQMFEADAGLGTEEMGDGGRTPILTLLSSQSGPIKEGEQDCDGNDLKIGNYFHSETRKQYKTLEVSILYIKEARLPVYQKPEELALNYVIGGVIRDETKAPFIMYVKGMSLSAFFDFKNDIARLKSHVPMYALIVELTTDKKESGSWGKVNTIKMSVKYDKNGSLMVETDVDTVKWLRDGFDATKQAVNNIILSATNDDDEDDDEVIEAEDAEYTSDDLPEELK